MNRLFFIRCMACPTSLVTMFCPVGVGDCGIGSLTPSNNYVTYSTHLLAMSSTNKLFPFLSLMHPALQLLLVFWPVACLIFLV